MSSSSSNDNKKGNTGSSNSDEKQFLKEYRSGDIFQFTEETRSVSSAADDRTRMNEFLVRYRHLYERYNIEWFSVGGDGRGEAKEQATRMYYNTIALESAIVRHDDQLVIEALERENQQLATENERLRALFQTIQVAMSQVTIGSSTVVHQQQQQEEQQEEEEQEEEREEAREDAI